MIIAINPNVDFETAEQIMRKERNRLLQESDWTQLDDAPVDKNAWAIYRQALRDLPTIWQPGSIVEFPDAP